MSGPAGGVVGYAMTTYGKETDLPVIGFDMGGTSTDVSRYGGSYEHVYESTTAGVTIQAAQVYNKKKIKNNKLIITISQRKTIFVPKKISTRLNFQYM